MMEAAEAEAVIAVPPPSLSPPPPQQQQENTCTVSLRRLPEEAIFHILTYFDIRTLIQKKIVCRHWEQIIINVIDAKQILPRKIFQSNEELRNAVQIYHGLSKNPNYDNGTCLDTDSSENEEENDDDNGDDEDDSNNNNNNKEEEEVYLRNTYGYCDPKDAEELARTYGWPIGKWNVSHIQDFSFIFCKISMFNEDISFWDVSHGTTMFGMFWGAETFNPKKEEEEQGCGGLSRWDTSQVTNMSHMFAHTKSFSGDLSSWDVSNVTTMFRMFYAAKAFQPLHLKSLSTWDTSNVVDMAGMFEKATLFNGDISTWNTGNVSSMYRMFYWPQISIKIYQHGIRRRLHLDMICLQVVRLLLPTIINPSELRAKRLEEELVHHHIETKSKDLDEREKTQ